MYFGAVFDKDIVFCEEISKVWLEWPGKGAVCPTEALMCHYRTGWVSAEARSCNVGHFIFIHYILLWEVLQSLKKPVKAESSLAICDV